MVIALVGACLVFILGVVGNAAHHAFERSSAELSGATPKAQVGVGGGGGGGVVLVGSSGGGHSGPDPRVPPPDSAASGEPNDSTNAGGTDAGNTDAR
jgi:hypothetical protein